MDEKLNIHVTIGERTYPMAVYRHEEEIVRKAAKNINEFFTKYKLNYSGYEAQDYLAMAALHFSKEFMKVKKMGESKQLENQLKELELRLDAILNQQ